MYTNVDKTSNVVYYGKRGHSPESLNNKSQQCLACSKNEHITKIAGNLSMLTQCRKKKMSSQMLSRSILIDELSLHNISMKYC